MLTKYLLVIYYIILICFPFTTINVKKTKDWLTAGLRKSSEKLKFLHRVVTQTNDINDINYYKSYKKIYRKVIKAAKRLFNDTLYLNSSNKSKAAWSIINNNLNNKQNNKEEHEILINDNLENNAELVANHFNKYFTDIPKTLSSKNFNNTANSHEFKLNKNFPTIFIEPATENEIFNIVMSLKNSNSSGVDNISSNILKCVAQFIKAPLTYLVNWSLNTGIFPDELKTAKIVPLYKKGNQSCVENYRPISMLSVISKILEKVVFNRMKNFLSAYNILNMAQHGFREGRSTQTAILGFLKSLYENLDNNKKCLGLFMDLSKAFDLVDHAFLINKLEKYGFRGRLGDWLLSYLSDRKQIVDIDGTRSNVLEVTCGVPQGSILGPLLFIVFVNDLPDNVNCTDLTMFADDNSYLSTHLRVPDLVSDTQEKLNSFVLWFTDNKLLINASKTVFMLFSPKSANTMESQLIKINNKSIEQVHSTKFLGVHIDSTLNWEIHIDNLCKKLSSVCYALYRLKQVANKNVVLSYYYAQFFSRIAYGIIFWGSSHFAARVFKVQKKAIRNIAGVSMFASCRDLFKTYQVLTLASLYVLEIVCFVKQNITEFLNNNFHHNYDTRGQDKLLIPLHSLTLYEKNPYYIGIQLYNRLPDSIKEINSKIVFKNKVKKLLLDKSFYTIDEYLEYST